MISTVSRYTLGSLIQLVSNLVKYPFSKSSRHKLSAAYLSMQYPFYGKQYVELSEILTNDELEVTISPLKSNPHNTTEFELLAICSVIKDKGINKILEIGTFDGRTTRAMAMNTGASGFVYTLNLPPETATSELETGDIDIKLASKVVSGERFINTLQASKIKQIWGDSALFDFSPYRGTLDMVFIDGAHSEEYVKNDTEKALQMIKPEGGYIMWHDAHLFGVVHYMKKLVLDQKQPIYFIKNTTVAVAAVKDGRFTDIKSGK
jgi:predicted O-methyltransferase YrrM